MEITTNSQGEEIVRCIRPIVEPSAENPGRVTNSLKIFQAFVNSLRRWPNASDFHSPVDAIELGVPDYYQIITKPMDLSTIQQRLENNYYYSVEEAIGDFRQMLDNCFLFNKESHLVHMAGLELQQVFEREVKKLPVIEEEINLQPATVRRRQVSVTTTLTRIVPAYILQCRDIFRAVMEDCRDFVQQFFYPKDLEKLCVGEEHIAIVKHSTDLRTIRMKLDQCLYNSMDEFLCDMRLIYMNALQLSMPHNEIYKQAGRFRDSFELHIAREEAQCERPLTTSTPNTWLGLEPGKQSSATHSVSVDGNVVRILSHATNPADEEWMSITSLLNEFIEKAERLTDKVSSLKEEYLKHGDGSIGSTENQVNKEVNLVKESIQIANNNRDRSKVLPSIAPILMKSNFPIVLQSKVPFPPKSRVPSVPELNLPHLPRSVIPTAPDVKVSIEPKSNLSIAQEEIHIVSETNFPVLSEQKVSFVSESNLFTASKYHSVPQSSVTIESEPMFPAVLGTNHDHLLMDLDVSSSSSCLSDTEENQVVEMSTELIISPTPITEKQLYDRNNATLDVTELPVNSQFLINSKKKNKVATLEENLVISDTTITQAEVGKKLFNKVLQSMNNGSEMQSEEKKLPNELANTTLDVKTMPVMRDKTCKDLSLVTKTLNYSENRTCTEKRPQLEDEILEPKFEPWQAVKAAPWQIFENDLISMKETKPKYVIVRIPLQKYETKQDSNRSKQFKKKYDRVKRSDYQKEGIDGYDEESQSSSSSVNFDSESSTDSPSYF